MKKKKQNSFESKYWLLILIVICILLMGLSFVTDGKSGPFRGIANYTIVPMQRGVSKIGIWMGDLTDNFKTLQELKSQNKDLQEKVDNLTIDNNRLQLEKYELDRLQELYKLDANYADYEKVGARVIGKDAGNWFSTFIIDKGSNDGLKVDMNVMAGAGLVGIVVETGPNWATVRSIIDDASNVSAMTLSTADTCMVRGDLKLMKDGKIKFEQLANNKNKIEVGEYIVTSHVSNRFVQGVLVGYISEIKMDANNLTRSGYITPAVDFKHLQEVLVITKTKQSIAEE